MVSDLPARARSSNPKPNQSKPLRTRNWASTAREVPGLSFHPCTAASDLKNQLLALVIDS